MNRRTFALPQSGWSITDRAAKPYTVLTLPLMSSHSVHNIIVTLETRWLIARTPSAGRSIQLLLSRDKLPDLH
jgi:hypothetical protein